MTVLVGILCSDGVVVGADSAATCGDGVQVSTVVQPYHKKVVLFRGKSEAPGHEAIVATTGQMGLSQRVERVVQQHCDAGTFAQATAVEAGVAVCKDAVYDFSLTRTPNGSIGALMSFWCKDGPALVEFGIADFQPEVKTKELWWASMGSGEAIADPVLALLSRAFCCEGLPRLSRGIFMAVWALSHVIEKNPGGVKGPMHLAALRSDGQGKFRTEMVTDAELGEHHQNVESVYEYLSKYPGLLQQPDAAELPEPA